MLSLSKSRLAESHGRKFKCLSMNESENVLKPFLMQQHILHMFQFLLILSCIHGHWAEIPSRDVLFERLSL